MSGCRWCRDGTYDGQTVMLSNHGWVDIRHCPECGRALSYGRKDVDDAKRRGDAEQGMPILREQEPSGQAMAQDGHLVRRVPELQRDGA